MPHTNNKEVERIAEVVRYILRTTNSYLHFNEDGITSLREELSDFLHHELQKAREEERKKVLWNIGAMIEEADFARKVTERIGEALPTLEVQAVIKQVQTMLDSYHSELDQDKK